MAVSPWRLIFQSLVTVLLFMVALHWNTVRYGLAQAAGQVRVLWYAQPIEDLLQDSTVADSLKQRLYLVRQIKHFATDSLGLIGGNSYTKVYDQQGKDIMWMVTACPPYAFTPQRWSFPIVGTFPYKGFFDTTMLAAEAEALQAQGLQIYVRPVTAWSTLGWFNDPVLSNMLQASEGSLANTIIHELTHGTVFINDSVRFNENLATFIGNEGAGLFLAGRYGAQSPRVKAYYAWLQNRVLFRQYMKTATRGLDSLYKSFAPQTTTAQKQAAKNQYWQQIVANIDTTQLRNKESYKRYLTKNGANNALLVGFINYNVMQDQLYQQWQQEHNSNLPAYIEWLKQNLNK